MSALTDDVQADKCLEFQALHESPDAFIIPNPWDVGSARIFQGLGFKALATTSSGFAYTLGKNDGEPTLLEQLEHCRALAAATEIPISVDFENGYAASPEAVAANVSSLMETGVAGCSIEDFDRDDKVLYELPLAVERVAAAVEAVKGVGFPFMLTARAEHLLRGGSDLDEVITRLQAFESAGADVLYAPGITRIEDLRVITSAVSKPVNVLGVMMPNSSVADFHAAGAKRISIGGALTYAAVRPVIEFGERMLNEGSFAWTSEMASGARISELLAG